jgi:hypothetical protein
VRIDALVLRGFPERGARDIRDAMAAELTQLLASQGVPPSMLAMHGTACASAGSIDAPPSASRPGVGEQIARAVYGVRR